MIKNVQQFITHTAIAHLPPALLASLAAILAAALPFLSTLTAYFTCDDFGLIQLFSPKPLWHFLTLFTAPWTETIYGHRVDELRPFLALSYQLDALWGATSPVGYHATNILLHVANVLLVLVIARRIANLGWPASTFAAVLFAVLPIQAETVAWISGRADSQPALTYLATFIAYAFWRRTGRRRWYLLAVAAFWLALYSKQSAITTPATLVMYDLLVERIPLRRLLQNARVHLPFVALTVYYLGLRFVLFRNVVRESELSPERLIEFALTQATFLQMLLSGRQEFRTDPPTTVLALLTLAAAGLLTLRTVAGGKPRPPGDPWGLLLYFGPVWWVISVAPLIVTYVSVRHLYLASAGAAIVAGLGFEALWRQRGTAWRRAAAGGAAALLVAYTAILVDHVNAWNTAAALSQTVTRDVQREAAAAPEGSLLLLGAPSTGPNPAVWTWVWGFALPFALQPPFAEADLHQRVGVVGDQYTYCCLPEQWRDRSRKTIEAWAARPERPPLIALDWDRDTGALVRRTDRELPALRPAALEMAAAATPEEMMRRLAATLHLVRSSS